jgi:hypothetical protein
LPKRGQRFTSKAFVRRSTVDQRLFSYGLVVALASGCVWTSDVVQRQMSADNDCPVDYVAVSQLPGNAYRAVGCGHTATFYCYRLTSQPDYTCIDADKVVQERMSADTNCPGASIAVSELPGNGYRAVGCGLTATFVCTGGTGGVTCAKEATDVGSVADAGSP